VATFREIMEPMRRTIRQMFAIAVTPTWDIPKLFNC